MNPTNPTHRIVRINQDYALFCVRVLVLNCATSVANRPLHSVENHARYLNSRLGGKLVHGGDGNLMAEPTKGSRQHLGTCLLFPRTHFPPHRPPHPLHAIHPRISRQDALRRATASSATQATSRYVREILRACRVIGDNPLFGHSQPIRRGIADDPHARSLAASARATSSAPAMS
jgi:hypothetical protein